jgi:hypothetical protein
VCLRSCHGPDIRSCQGTGDRKGYGPCNGRRESIADLAVRCGPAAFKNPFVREALQTRGHAHRQARSADKVWAGRKFCNAASINPKLKPGFARTCRAKIRAAMLLRPANQRRRNSCRLGCPLLSARPTSRCHQIAQGMSNTWTFFRSRDRPPETLGKSRRKANDHHTGPKLGHTKIGCMKQLRFQLQVQRLI